MSDDLTKSMAYGTTRGITLPPPREVRTWTPGGITPVKMKTASEALRRMMTVPEDGGFATPEARAIHTPADVVMGLDLPSSSPVDFESLAGEVAATALNAGDVMVRVTRLLRTSDVGLPARTEFLRRTIMLWRQLGALTQHRPKVPPPDVLVKGLEGSTLRSERPIPAGLLRRQHVATLIKAMCAHAGDEGVRADGLVPELVQRFGRSTVVSAIASLRGEIRHRDGVLYGAHNDALEKAFPIGTIRRWISGYYRKQSEGSWKRVGDPTHGGKGAAGGPKVDDEHAAVDVTPLGAPAGEPRQPVATREALFEHARHAVADLAHALVGAGGIAQEVGLRHHIKREGQGHLYGHELARPGGLVILAPIKGQKRAALKVERKYGGDWSRLTDVVRATVAVDTYAEMNAVVHAIAKRGFRLAEPPTVRLEHPTATGYRDIALLVRMPETGMLAEIQLHLKPMLWAKELGPGNELYRTIRTIRERAKAEGRRPTPTESTRMARAERRSQRLFDSVWASITRAR